MVTIEVHCDNFKFANRGTRTVNRVVHKIGKGIRDFPEDHNTLRERDIRFNRK